MNLDRRSFITGLAAVPLVAAIGGGGGDAGPRYNVEAPRVALAWIKNVEYAGLFICLLYTSPSPRDLSTSRMPSSA